MTVDELDRRFTHHPPRGDQPTRHQAVRSVARQLADVIADACPDGRERSLAMTRLEECVMWANAAIAREP